MEFKQNCLSFEDYLAFEKCAASETINKMPLLFWRIAKSSRLKLLRLWAT